MAFYDTTTASGRLTASSTSAGGVISAAVLYSYAYSAINRPGKPGLNRPPKPG